VDVGIPLADGPCPLAQVHVTTDHQPADHVANESPPSRVRKRPCDTIAKRVQSAPDLLGPSIARPWYASLRALQL
jgi:hypothetical protein